MRAEARPLELVISRSEGPLAAAVYFLAVLGYPETREQDKRTRADLAMRAWYARQFIAQGRDSPKLRALIRELPAANMRNTLRRLQGRLDRALKAGGVFAQLLMRSRRPSDRERAELELVRRSRALGKSDSEIAARIRQLPAARAGKGSPWGLKAFAEASGEGEAFYSRTWKTPALPLAFALHSVRLKWPDSREFNVERLLAEPAWALRALEQAEAWARCLPQITNLPPALAKSVHRARFIRVTFID